MRPWTVVFVGVFAFGLACTGEVEPTASTPPMTLEEKVGAVARAASVDEAGRKAALEEHGLTQAEYEAALFDIAMDANRTRSYEKARAGK